MNIFGGTSGSGYTEGRLQLCYFIMEQPHFQIFFGLFRVFKGPNTIHGGDVTYNL